MTTVLAIETATTRLSVAIGDGLGPPASVSVDGDRRHVEVLVPTVEQLLALSGRSLAEIDVLAVDVGPGLFTGMRVGISTAQGLALALDRPVQPVRSVDVVAHPLRQAHLPVLVVLDARRGEVFRSLHVEGSPIGPVTCTTPEAVAEEAATIGAVHVVGDGAVRYRDVIERRADAAIVAPAWPSAEAVVALALASTARPVDPGRLSALYLRDADAVPNFEVAR